MSWDEVLDRLCESYASGELSLEHLESNLDAWFHGQAISHPPPSLVLAIMLEESSWGRLLVGGYA